MSENSHFIFSCLIDSLARYTRLGWKSCYFIILKALLHYLLASVTTEKSEDILIFYFFPLNGSM